jgi:hypothetical protein
MYMYVYVCICMYGIIGEFAPEDILRYDRI